MSPYVKAIRPALLTLVAVAASYIATGDLGKSELAIGATGLIGSSLVYFTTNVPGWPFLKALVPAVTGSLAAVSLWIENGVLNKEDIAIFLTALGTAAVAYYSTNKSNDVVVVNSLGSEAAPAAQPAAY